MRNARGLSAAPLCAKSDTFYGEEGENKMKIEKSIEIAAPLERI
jgi:hypothetical protein